MKFKVAIIKDGQQLIKFVLDDGEEIWAETSQKVYDFAKKNFEENEICDFDYEEKDDGSYYVDRILKKEGGSSSKPSPKKRGRGRPKKFSSSTSGKVCECGTEIKNAKYSQCYECNQAKKKTKSEGGKYCECGTEIKNTKYDKCYECNQAGKEEKSDDKKYCTCGTEIKNHKYDKCYNCNKENKGSSGSGKPDYEKGAPYGSVTEGEAIRRNKLAVLGSIASAIGTAMAGQVEDADALIDMIIEAHKKIYKELFG